MGYKSKWTGEEIDSVLNSTLSRELSESQLEAIEAVFYDNNTSLLTKEDFDFYMSLGVGDLYAQGRKLPYSIGMADEYSIDFILSKSISVVGTEFWIDYALTHLYLDSDGSIAGKSYFASHSLPAEVTEFPNEGGGAPPA